MIKAGKHFWFGAALGTLLGWTVAQQGWLLWQLKGRNVRQTLAAKTNRAPKGRLFENRQERTHYTRTYTIEDGIERVRYLPKARRFETPLLFQHGMWQGAWSWRLWQALFAGWGWESYAYSLPGHAGSPAQRSPALATLDYYLSFLKAEVARLPRRPVLIGHSMGGGIGQWYLKYVGSLPAAVLVGSMPSHSVLELGKALLALFKLDPVGLGLTLLTWQPAFVRNPKRAARLLLSEEAAYDRDAFYARLSPGSLLALYQHNPPFWRPPEQVDTPILWLTGDQDVAVSPAAQRRSAAYYQAEHRIVPGAGHNLMMEHTYRQTAETIHHWLVAQKIE